LYAGIPTYEAVQEVRLEALGYKNRIADLERHKSEGGFGLDAHPRRRFKASAAGWSAPKKNSRG
jgi:hypothetical protein